MKQNSHILMIALLLILLSLSGCARSDTFESTDIQPAASLPAEPPPAQTEEQQQAPGFPENIREELETLPDSCMAVLLGEGTFLAENGESLMIDQVDRAFFDDSEFPIKASQFAVVDLDYDGTAEIVIQLVFDDKNYSDASLVLHDRDGTATAIYSGFGASTICNRTVSTVSPAAQLIPALGSSLLRRMDIAETMLWSPPRAGLRAGAPLRVMPYGSNCQKSGWPPCGNLDKRNGAGIIPRRWHIRITFFFHADRPETGAACLASPGLL